MACGGSCGSCSTGCGTDEQQVQDLHAPMHELSNVKHIIGVISGKGGVGKSSVTSMLAVTMARKGFKTAILDADITGPSIPKIFGIHSKAHADEVGMYPTKTETGIDIMSVNLLLQNETDPVLWRGPIVGNVVKQFYSDVIWKDIDYMFVDMPPGTGDVALTVFQSMKLDGIIIVTTPQDLVSMIVEKAVKMADIMQVPIVGVVENYSYFHCPDNGKDYKIFGESHVEEILQKHNLLLLGRLPIDPEVAKLCDTGKIETLEKTNLEDIALPGME